jgi:hypothetical protein
MNYTFADYEELILAALAGLKAPDGPLAVLAGFAGEIVLTEAGLLLVLLNRFPAALVEISDAAYQPFPHPYFTQEVTVSLSVCARSLRSQDEARGGEAGAYAILHQIREKLLGLKLAADLLPLLLVRERKVAATFAEELKYVTVYEAQYKFTNPRVSAA